MKVYDLVIIGGGASGMLCAIEAKKSGFNNILVLEKNPNLGGALNNGNYRISDSKDITGKEYYKDLLNEYNKFDIETHLNTMVLNINDLGNIMALSPDRGMEEISAKNIILTNGAKEKGRNALNMPGDRCAGVITLGTAKNILNIDSVIPGKDIVIYGSENLHIIMEDLKNKKININCIICEKPSNEATHITNNIYENSHITSIIGNDRVNSVKISDGSVEKTIKCDTVILALGMLSDGLVSLRSKIELNPTSTGPKVDENFQTSRKNIYACGNGIYIHETIDKIESEAKHLIKNISINNK